MKNYKVLIVGMGNGKWESTKTSAQMLQSGLNNAFKKRLNSEIECIAWDSKKFPTANLVIMITYFNTPIDKVKLHEDTKCKKLITVREGNFKGVDYSFVFIPHLKVRRNTQLIPFVYADDILEVKEKEKNTILIDHFWPKKRHERLNWEWTFRISDWLQDISDEYKIYRIMRKHDEFKIKDYEIEFSLTYYLDYVKNTDNIENFIITHHECFPYGVIDMAVRGIRVFSPKGFLPDVMVEKFNIEIFEDKKSLLDKLATPVDSYWNYQKYKCITYDELASIINDYYIESLKK